MATTKQYGDHQWVIEALKKAQEADHDMREAARESHLFAHARDGQWEPYWWDQNEGKPRYTFDMINPIIDQVAGAMDNRDFDIRVSPAGGDSSEDVAEIYDGLIRNIENMSGARDIYGVCAREMVTTGFSGWRVVQKYVDDDAFDQDLVIERVGNWLDRVWFGPHEKPDGSDARYAWVLTGMDPDVYKEKYPDRGGIGVDSDRRANAYFYRQDLVMVGEFYYLKPQERELVLMSNGRSYEVDDEFQSVVDELQELGVVEVRRRKRTKNVVCRRLFDSDGWLEDERETVFENWIPVIPMYGNFRLFEDKITYWGVVEKLMDPQRVMNYSLSREIEEGALAPRAKKWLTPEQAEGHEEELATMNVNSDPFQLYNHVDGQQPPWETGGAAVNPGLRTISEAMRQIIGQSAGMFAANMGDNPGLQSGVAIEALQDRGDQSNNKYVAAREVAQRHTARILVNAIPRVYTEGREVRVMGEDGGFEMKTLGDKIIDNDSGQIVILNDMSQGRYDVECHSGPSFRNRQSETVSAITELAQVDPSVIEMAKDILFNNITSPGMDAVAQRARQQLFQAGIIPFEQMTDDEKQQYQQMMQQPPQESPEMVLARAEEAKAQADLIANQVKQVGLQMEAQDAQERRKIDAFNAETNRLKAEVERAKAQIEVRQTIAATAKTLSEAEAQDIENDLTISGVSKLGESLKNMQAGGGS